MQKLIGAMILFFILNLLQTKVFAETLNCKYKDANSTVEGIQSLKIVDGALVINNDLIVPLEKTNIKCGKLGRQVRMDGLIKGLQITLKSCSIEAELEGLLIDSVNAETADVICGSNL